jgi:CO dehydrogenase maturation factor
MPYIIAFAGKGGTGKTSIAALTVKYLLQHRRGPVLAVDADSNACLNEALGVQVHTTVGRLREQSLKTIREGDNRPGGLSMEEFLEYQVHQALVESEGFDLLVMGRPEGPGCYCAANNIIRKYTDYLSEKYPYVVIDNEAGMEHLSRRTTHRVNLLLIISDPTVKGIKTADRINRLIDELELDIKERALIINRVTGKEEEELRRLAEEMELTVVGTVPDDQLVLEFDLKGRPIFQVPEDSVALKAVYDTLDSLNIP